MPRKLTGSSILGKALQIEGIQNVFTLAGDHVLPALDTLSDMEFRFVDTRHEAAAVHMADAWARVTGSPGVAMYTTPGFANAIPGLTSALHSEGLCSPSAAPRPSPTWAGAPPRRSSRSPWRRP